MAAKLRPGVELDLRMRLWQAAEDEAVRVFAGNLRDLLLAAPAGTRPTLGLDPRYRTGVKVAVVDATGKVVATDTIYPHEPKRLWTEAVATLARLCETHRVELVAIGNGTASRETDKLAGELLARYPDLKLTKVIVSEAGASVYSASAYASQELPDLDVSSARRGLDRPSLAGPAGRAGQDRPQVDRSRPVPARFVRAQALALSRWRRGRLRQRGWGGREHRLRCPAHARVGPRRVSGREDRGAPQPARPLPDPQGSQAGARVRAKDVRAVGWLPAHPERGPSPGCVWRASGGLPGRAPDPESGQE